MAEYEELFKFAAKAGALEGYLYEREKIEPLANWTSNMDNMYHSLSPEIKQDVNKEYGIVLGRILSNGEKVLPNEIKARLNNMLSELA